MEENKKRFSVFVTAGFLAIIFSTVFSQPYEGASAHGSYMYGDRCMTTIECGFMHSVCDSVQEICVCPLDLPITNHIDRCGKAAKLKEACYFSEQCEALDVHTLCLDGVCGCKFDQEVVLREDGTSECRDFRNLGHKLYGDTCNTTMDCGFANSICDFTLGKCICSLDFPITNYIDKCGKAAKLEESCSFSEQCEATNAQTTCINEACACKYDREVVLDEDGISECKK